MKVIIAGGRDFDDYSLLEESVADLFCRSDLWGWCRFGPPEIVSGGARGADRLGERLAEVCGLTVTRFTPAWDKHGKGAGYIRNVEMAVYADILVAFWDGESKGTKHMIDIALARGLEVHVYPYTT